MPYLFIIVILIAVFLCIRLFSFRKEVKKIGRQLQKYNHQKTNKKIDMALLNRNIEGLGTEINHLIDMHVKEKRERIRFENELKQAVANMSHDLRTPLTSILGYIQMAESNDITAKEQKEYISIAKDRAKRLETLLNDFFELSVIESADFQLKSEPINLKPLTIDMLMSFFDRFNDKNMEPIINMPERDVFIKSDESAVSRIIENLISNAITHSDGNIRITLEEIDATVRLIVQNNTHALTDNDVDHLFDRFYMADGSRSGKSTGLGLSIVKSFMQKMDGNITGKLNDGQLSIICEWKSSGK
ncbi:two-component sensor histidine kinase [Virgibacillus indicus]|uniref:histidine kinase n=1 Tax=Virgibacillus indicus TaxID=2024554 RepID=A0A265N5P5_9BACI|nr:two-component sensor histidine kinase [Virgibacillus indicus]